MPSLVVALGLWLASAPPEVQLRFVSEVPSCPDEEEFRARVAARLGYAPFSDEAPRALEVSFVEQREGFAARLVLRDASGVLGERALTTTGSCAELAEGVALAASVAIDPELLWREGAPSPQARAIAKAPPAPRPAELPRHPPSTTSAAGHEAVTPAPLPAPRAASRAGLRVESGVGLLVGAGPEPGPTVGAELSLGVAFEPASLHLEAAFDLPSYASVGGGAEVSGTLVAARAAPCLRAGQLGGCALVVGGFLLGAGHGLLDEHSGVGPYVAAGGRVFLDWPLLERLTLRLRGDATAALVHPVFVDDRTRELLWQPLPVAASVGLQLLAALP